MKNKIILEITRREAKEFGLLICECGWPENNHFKFGRKKCAHDLSCTGYKEVSRIGKILRSRNESKRTNRRVKKVQ